MPNPLDKWRQDLNDKMDRWGEDHLHLKPKSYQSPRSINSSYEERLAGVRSGGGATGYVSGANSVSARSMPPPPPVTAGTGAVPPPPVRSAAVVSPTAAPAPAAVPQTSTQILYSRFTEDDKQAFFSMLDHYFAQRKGADRLDDPFDAPSLQQIGHGLCSLIVKAPWPLSSVIIQEAGGVPGWVCLKQVDEDVQNRPHDIQREMLLLRRLRHAHLADLLAAFTETQDAFTTVYQLVMPMYPVRLTDVLRDRAVVPGPGPLADCTNEPWHSILGHHSFTCLVVQIGRQLLDALKYLHHEGVAHRDLKPSNILFGQNAQLKLIDLGVAWERGMQEHAPHDPAPADGLDVARVSDVGSGAFRAPELLFAPLHGYDAFAADMWSVGTVLAQFFTALQETEEEPPLRPGFSSWERELFPDRPHEDELRHWAKKKYERTTLFHAANGDIALACDIFKVLGRPSEVAAWPEAAYFQPPLDQFPFVSRGPSERLLDRLPHCGALGRDDGSAAAETLQSWAETWFPRLLQLSASQRPSADALAASWPIAM